MPILGPLSLRERGLGGLRNSRRSPDRPARSGDSAATLRAAAARTARRPADRSTRGAICPNTLSGAIGAAFDAGVHAAQLIGRPAQPAELLGQHLGGERMPDRLRQVLRRFERAFGPGIVRGPSPAAAARAPPRRSSPAAAARRGRSPANVFRNRRVNCGSSVFHTLVRAAPCPGRCPGGRRSSRQLLRWRARRGERPPRKTSQTRPPCGG